MGEIVMSDQNNQATKKIVGVVLAAGAASRFGRPKQLERWPHADSPTFVERVVSLLLSSQAAAVWVVTGNQHAEVEKALARLQATHSQLYSAYNARWQAGQGYSVAVGTKSVVENFPTASGIMFMLADQPRLKIETVRNLVQEFQDSENSTNQIFFPTYKGKRGNPVIFGRQFFDELVKLEGDAGGRVIVKKYPEAVVELEVDDPAIHEDVDTPADLAALSEKES